MPLQRGEPVRIARGALDSGGERAGVADREIARIVGAQHPQVPRHARGDHRRARRHRLGDDIRPAFQAGGDHEHVRAADRLPRPAVRARAEPADARIGGAGAAHVVAEVRIERAADDRERRGEMGGQAAPCGERGARILLVAQVRHQDRVEARRRLRGERRERPRRLQHDRRLRPSQRGEVAHGVVLQHDQPVGIGDRGERIGIAGRHVAVEIGAGERDDERTIGMRALPCGDRRAAAARVQRQQRDRTVARAAGHRRVGRLVESRESAARAGATSARRCASCRCWRPRGTA